MLPTPPEILPVAAAPGPLLRHAACGPMPSMGWLRVTGEDRVRWLNGMVTNSIQALVPGAGCYNFVLNAQGRIQADATAFALPDEILLQTANPGTLATLLDHFIIMDDVELAVVAPAKLLGLTLSGPAALSCLTGLGLTPPESAPALVEILWEGSPVRLIHAHSPLVPRFELWATPAVVATLISALEGSGVVRANDSDLIALRLLEGTPLVGVDIRERDLPQETAQSGQPSRALHFAKGCYLGQEIVERIRSRGNVHRALSGFILSGELPPPNTSLAATTAPDKSLGELTTVARIDLSDGPILLALGIVRREALLPGAELVYPGGAAQPVELPYRAALTAHPNPSI